MNNTESKTSLLYTVSVVVPVYNSEATMDELVARINDVLETAAGRFEIILVNDGSKDGSWEVISNLAGKMQHVRGVNLMHNYGQHNALLAGIQRAQYEIIVTIDDDLQNPPEEIPKLISRLNEGYDVVYGRPSQRSHSVWRNISSKILKGYPIQKPR